jgi:hypothetical protein
MADGAGLGLLLLTLAAAAQQVPWLAAMAKLQLATSAFGAERLAMALLLMGLAPTVPWLGARARGLVLAVAVIFLGIAIADRAAHDALNPDEMFHLHITWMISQGLVPYRDFFHHQQPLWYLLAVPLVRVMDGNVAVVEVARWLTCLQTLATMLVAMDLVRRLGGTPMACPLLLLSLPGFSETAFQVRPEPCLLLLATLDLLLAARPSWAGVAAGAAWWLSPKALVAIALAGLLPRPSARYYVPLAVAGGLFVVALIAFGVVAPYCDAEFRFNSLVAACMWEGTTWLHNTATLHLWHHIEAVPVFWCLVLAGSVLAWRRQPVLVPVLLASWALVFYTRLGQPQYVTFPTALAGVVAAVAIAPSLSASRRLLRGSLPAMTLLLVAGLALLRYAAEPPVGFNLDGARTSLAHVPPGGTFLATGIGCELNHPIFRRDAGFYPQIYADKFIQLANHGYTLTHPLHDDLVAHPPDAMCLGWDRDTVMAEMAAAGIHYRDVGHGVLARVP